MEGGESISTRPFLTKVPEISSPFLRVWVAKCQLMMMKTLKNWNWYRGKVLFSRAFPPLHLTYIRVGTKLLTKNSWKTYVSLCSLWKKATLFFLTPAVDIFRLLLKNTVTIVLGTTFWPSTLWFSQVKLQHPIIYERAL